MRLIERQPSSEVLKKMLDPYIVKDPDEK